VKARPFKLSGPALEVLSIVAYKQPTTKAQIDEIRGVESGHLLRALMEKGLLNFGERSDLPGKPMFYETTRKFLEIFSLRNLQELPSLGEIDQLIPEGIGEIEDKETLSDLTEKLSQQVGSTYSEGEDELLKISGELDQITTSSEFFEQEKVRQREKRDAERAQDIRERVLVGEAVDDKDKRWLERHENGLAQAAQGESEVEFVTEGLTENQPATESIEEAPGDEPPPEQGL
jgi:segregation and condensation protein B